MKRSPLRVGVVCYSSYGGSGVIAAELSRGLAQRGHVVHLLASAPPARGVYDTAPVFFHEVSTADYPVFDQPPYALAVASKIVEVAQDHGLDLVHAHYAVPHSTSAYLARQVLGTDAPAVVTTLHGTDVTRVGVEPSIQRINRFSIEASDAVTVPSEFLRQAAYHQLGLSEEFELDVVPNFVDPEHFRPDEAPGRAALAPLFGAPFEDDTRVLVHVSNFRPVKRVPDVVEVFAEVRRARSTRLLLVGDGPERAKVAARVRELGLTKEVSFLGTMVELAAYLRHADLFLMPSETESFGLAALEAMASGVPVVAYDVGGLPEVVRDGETGRLTPPHDPARMAEAVQDLLTHEPRRLDMARAARQDALRRFSPEAALDRYESVYRRALEVHGSLG